MKDNGFIHNRILPDCVHRLMNGIFGTVMLFTVGAVGWHYLGHVPVLGAIFPWFISLAVPFGIVMLFVNPRKISLVEGHTAQDIAYDELIDDDEDNESPEDQNRKKLLTRRNRT